MTAGPGRPSASSEWALTQYRPGPRMNVVEVPLKMVPPSEVHASRPTATTVARTPGAGVQPAAIAPSASGLAVSESGAGAGVYRSQNSAASGCARPP